MTSGDPESILREARTIAVVGLSNKPDRPAYQVALYLQQHGYRIIPVNPRQEDVLGAQAYPSVSAIPEPVDVVDVFRRSEHTPDVARDAAYAGAKALWLQAGISHPEARRIAGEAGLAYVENMCMRVVHARMQAHSR